MTVDYTRGERLWLWALAVLGLIGVDGVFLWTLFFRPETMREALANPVTVAYSVEALALVAALAWLFHKWRVSRVGWGWFVVLSLLGSLAFAIPVALLFPRRER